MTELSDPRFGVVSKLTAIANASRRQDGSDIPLGELCRAAVELIESLESRLATAERDTLEKAAHAARIHQHGFTGDSKLLADVVKDGVEAAIRSLDRSR